MSDTDAVAGMYNIVVSDDRECADHRVPIDEFLTKLDDSDLPDELCVVGIEAVLTEDDSLRDELVSAMRREMDYLNSRRPLPAIQFVVEGDVQGAGDSFDVKIDGDFHSLEPIFGRQIKRREPGWLVAPFRV